MNEQQKFADEFINAFIDDQLTPEEKAQVYARLSGNEPLSRQICELRKVRDMVQLAYKEPPMPERGMASFAAAGRCLPLRRSHTAHAKGIQRSHIRRLPEHH